MVRDPDRPFERPDAPGVPRRIEEVRTFYDVSVLPQHQGTFIASVTGRGWERSMVGTSERDALIELVQDLARQLELHANGR